MADMNIVRDELPEKIEEVTSSKDLGEEPRHEVVLDLVVNVEQDDLPPVTKSSRGNVEFSFSTMVCFPAPKVLKEMNVFG